jgi:hypothetical protein
MMSFMPGSIVSLNLRVAGKASVRQGPTLYAIQMIESLQTKKGPPLMRVLCVNRNMAQVRIPIAIINGYPLHDLFLPADLLCEDGPRREEPNDYRQTFCAKMGEDAKNRMTEEYKIHRADGMNGVDHFVNYGLKRDGWELVHQDIKDFCKISDVWLFTDKKFKGPKPKDGRAVYVLGFYDEDSMHAVGDKFRKVCTGFRFLEAVRGRNAYVGMRVCKGPSWGQGVLRLQGWHEGPRWKNVKDEGLGTVVAVHAPGELSTECMVKVQWDDVALEQPGLQDTFWYRAGAEDVSGIEFVDLFVEPPTFNTEPPTLDALEALRARRAPKKRTQFAVQETCMEPEKGKYTDSSSPFKMQRFCQDASLKVENFESCFKNECIHI